MLSTYIPKYEDLWFKQLMLSDEATMSYNHAYGGTLPFPEERWQAWFDKWIVHNQGKRYYRYLKDEAGAFIGELSYHYEEEIEHYMVDVLIYSRYRGKGYGSQALKMICAAAKANGISELYDEIAGDNPAIGLFLKQGFTEISCTDSTVMLRKKL